MFYEAEVSEDKKMPRMSLRVIVSVNISRISCSICKSTRKVGVNIAEMILFFLFRSKYLRFKTLY